MTARKWIGGGLNLANDPNDWSPTGAPQPGDTLTINSGTITAYAYNLAGDTLDVTGKESVNLDYGASVNAAIFPGSAATFTLMDATLSLTTGGDELLYAGEAPTIVNLLRSEHFNLQGSFASFTISLSPVSDWYGVFRFTPGGIGIPVSGGTVTINGATGSYFINDGSSAVGTAVINAAVLGIGSFSVSDTSMGVGFLEFEKSIGSGRNVLINTPSISARLQLDDPTQFQGTVTVVGAGLGARIDLENLAKADSYSYSNDILSIYSGSTVIDTLQLVNAPPSAFRFEKLGSAVVLSSIHSPDPGGTVLPVHA